MAMIGRTEDLLPDQRYVSLSKGADIDKLEVFTFWPIAAAPSTDWMSGGN
jgi:hypothetical protein